MKFKGSCLRSKILLELAEGSSLKPIPHTFSKDPHEAKLTSLAYFAQLDRLLSGEVRPIYVYPNCKENAMVASVNRVLSSAIEPSLAAIARLRQHMLKLARRCPRYVQQPVEEWVNTLTGRKKARYESGLRGLRAEPQPLRKWSKTRMFVKWEKAFRKAAKSQPDCRAIQYRTAEYCVLLASFLKPMEHAIYELSGKGILPKTRVIGKGLSLDARARLCVEKWRSFEDPVAISIDASRFDKHCSRPILEVEHEFYTILGGGDPLLKQLLSWQLDNVGYGPGFMYKCSGRRMSGDINTALGNCVLMVLMVTCALRGLDIDLLDDGDDCLVFCEKRDLEEVRARLAENFREFGYKLTGLDNVATTIAEIEWCQSRIVFTQTGPKFVRDPTKVVNAGLSNSKFGHEPKFAANLLYTIGEAEMSLNAGVPILHEFSKMLFRSGKAPKKPMRLVTGSQHLLKYQREEKLATAITDEARVSFSAAFGISIAQQLSFERQLSATTLSLSNLVDVVAPVNEDDWSIGSFESLPHMRD